MAILDWVLRLFTKPKMRVSLRNRSFDLPCAWCENVVCTHEEEVWSKANPEGRIVRLCVDCVSKCAAS